MTPTFCGIPGGKIAPAQVYIAPGLWYNSAGKPRINPLTREASCSAWIHPMTAKEKAGA